MADGSAAEAAYQRALEEIERVKAEGGQELWLTGFHDLDRIPPEVTDINGLHWLTLDGSEVSDLTPIAAAPELRHLYFSATKVTDLSPLRYMASLCSVVFYKTDISDLRPLLDLPLLGRSGAPGLSFSETTATRLDSELQRLSQILDDEQRTLETLAYLKTLPPWPGPLQWEDAAHETSAPLQVIEVEGILRPHVPRQGLPEASADLARQGWAAIRDFLSDLTTIRPRIDNQLPNLARALGRFESALGASFDELNAIALGTHGQRVIRMAASASETLSPDDAAEMREFAAAIALYLERFPTWRAYRREALEHPLTGDDVRRALPLVAEVEQAIDDRIGIDPAIPRALRDLRHAAQEEPADSVVGHGLLDSVGNVLSALARGLWSTAKASGRGLIWFVRQLAEKSAEKAVEKTVDAAFSTPVLAAAMDLFFNKGRVLVTIAEAFPDQFGWLLNFLRALGLA